MRLKFLKVTIAVVAVLPVLALLVANSWDEDLLPEVAAILSQQKIPTENGMKAFYYMIGLRSGETENYEARGKEIWEKHRRENPTQPIAKSFANSDPWPSYDLPMGPKIGSLTPKYLTENPTWKADLAKNKAKLDQYLDVTTFKELSLIPDAFPSGHVSWTVSFLKAHRWLQLYLASLAEENKWAEIEQIIQNENLFHLDILKQGYLLEYMVAILIISDNANFLEANLKQNSNYKLSQATIDSFTLPDFEDSFRGALNQEVIGMKEFLKDPEPIRFFADDKSMLRWDIFRIPIWYVLKPNQTINKYYELTQQTINTKCEIDPNDDDSDELSCLPAYQWASLKQPWHWPTNPIGRFILRMTAANTHGRYQKAKLRNQEIRETLKRLIAKQ